MRLVIWPLAAAVLGCAALQVPAAADTLVPGTYKMEWKIGKADDASPFGRRGLSLRPMTQDELATTPGLKSERCLQGSSEKLKVIIDESKGAGEGYDTAYVARVDSDDAPVDITKACRLALKKDMGVYRVDSGTPATMDIRLGEEGSQITKQTGVNLEVVSGGEDLQFAILGLLGGWQGTIKTDTGGLDIQVYDMNANGIYGDKVKVQEITPEDMPMPGDMILLGGIPEDVSDYGNMIYLGEVVYRDGKLYTFDLSKTGETLTIAPYAGEIGTVRVEAKDGYGKPADCAMFVFYGKSGLFMASGNRDIPVPAGKYACVQSQVIPKQSGPDEKKFGLSLRSASLVDVQSGKTAAFKLGGPLKADIEPEVGVITAKRGQDLRVDLKFAAGECGVAGITGDRNANVNIRDSKGKLMISGQAAFG